MFFLKALYRSLFDLTWLKAQRRLLGRGFVFALISTVLFIVLIAWPTVYKLPSWINQGRTVLEQTGDFQYAVHNGELSIVGLPSDPYTRQFSSTAGILNVVFDTSPTSTRKITDFVPDGKNTFLIRHNGVAMYDQNGSEKFEYFAVTPLQNTTTTKADVIAFFGRATQPRVLWTVGLIAFVIWIVVGFLLHIIATAILSLILLVIAAIKKTEVWSYCEIFTVSLFAWTLPYMLTVALRWLDQTPPLGLASLIMVAITLGVIFHKEEEKKTA